MSRLGEVGAPHKRATRIIGTALAAQVQRQKYGYSIGSMPWGIFLLVISAAMESMGQPLQFAAHPSRHLRVGEHALVAPCKDIRP